MKKFSLFLAFIVLFFSAAVYAGTPPAEPILRIESGMHTAKIGRIAVDASNRFLVTASNDKTLRVWELSTGRLLKVLRPPIGEGNEGYIYTVAISPDGKTIACSGWTGMQWGGIFIYFFDRATGELTGKVSNLPGTVNHITYSKDGKYLAAVFWKYGVNVIRVSDLSVIKEDRDYADNAYWADFDRSGRLVTTSYDGYIRLYDRSFNLMAKQRGRGGNRPYSVTFSPDASKIAVGYDDAFNADVLSGQDLSYLFSPDLSGTNMNISVLAWSFDGNYLYAGGMYYSGAKYPIRIFSDEGRGSYKEAKIANNSIMHMVPLMNGMMAFSSFEPSFGVIDREGNSVLFKAPSTADVRGNFDGFMVSYDGAEVRFGYEQWGRSPARFSLTERGIKPGESTLGLSPALTSYYGINITDWKYSYNPKLNGAKLSLDPYERSVMYAIEPDGAGFVVGADWSIRSYDKYGTQRWNVPAPGLAWAVNVSGNGKVAVAALGDGTIRWYRMRDGKELLALFPHSDRKRWILWTPSGYYDASPGAEELIGWHINNGLDKPADFFPASRFRNTYYRPDIVAKVLDTLDESEAVRLANEAGNRKTVTTVIQDVLPPIVTIVSPADNMEVANSEVVIRYSIRTPSGEAVTGVKALVDGRPVSLERGVEITPRDKDVRELRVSIPEKDSEVSIIAENRFASSEPATVRLRWKGAAKDEFIIKPKLYVLAVGVSEYDDKAIALKYAAKDAKDFASTVAKQKGVLYRDVQVKVLTDKNASRDEIMDGLDWIQKETTSKDVAMVFFAGHGIDDQNGIYYYLPVNANVEKLKRTGVVFSDIKNTLSTLAGKAVLFIDTCHSGSVMGGRRAVADINAIVNDLASAENGTVVFASSTGKQYSLENDAWGNGAFTKALIEGLDGKADMLGKGKITVNMLDVYIAERVKELTRGRQSPSTTKPNTVPDFPVAVKR